MLTLNDGRSELWQWDTGRTVSVDADCSQVHFSNKVFGRSIDVDVIDGIAIVPDILLQTDKDLNVWAFVGTAENGYTKISKTFKVNRRNKPSDYVFTPPDQTSLEEIKEKLDYLEQNPVEVPVQSVNGQTGEVKLTAKDVGAISQDDLQEATNEALAQAKESGTFDGPHGEPGRGIVSVTGNGDGSWTFLYTDGTTETVSSDAYDVLAARMNTFTALPEGSTTGDAELADIRVGHDGKSYENAGESVRSQVYMLFHEIKERVASLQNGKIEYDIGAVTLGGMISSTTGFFVVKDDIAFGASEYYIPLHIGETYTVSTENVGFNLYFYGADKEFIEALYNPQTTKKDTVTFTNTSYHYARVGTWVNPEVTQELFDTISFAIVTDGTTLEEIESQIANANKKISGWIDCLGTVEIDTEAKTMTFGKSAHIVYGGTRHNVQNTVHDISGFMNGQFLYFDPTTKTLSKAYSDGFVYLGALWVPQCIADLHITRGKFVVDGMPVTFTGRFYGKKVNCLGDSMTAGVGTTKAYHQWFRQLCGFSTTVNYGIGGSCISPKIDTVPTWEEGIASFCERYADMDNDADAVVVFGGVNDWVTGRTLGSITDTGTNTFYGAMKALCEGLIAKYPTSDIYVFSSPQNDYMNRPANNISGTAWDGNAEGYNRKGHKLQDYANAMREVCAVYGIPFYSLTDNLFWGLSGVLGDNNGTSGVYGSDALHPNAEGHKKIALKMAGFINSD